MPFTSRRLCRLLTFSLALLGGCASVEFTIDDGRRIDEALMTHIRAFGAGERILRPAIVRSADLADPDCSRVHELPFSVASSESWNAEERVAWVRALGVDERLTVIAVAAVSPLQLGERIVAVSGAWRPGTGAERLLYELGLRRDEGRPFEVVTDRGRRVKVTPFEVCRGYARFAPPNAPALQDYHWAMSLHPLELLGAAPTADEALWIVLWTQGLSEEGGLRMRAYQYGTNLVSTLYTLATLASGLKAAAVAAEAAGKTMQVAAAQYAAEALKQQALSSAGTYATRRVLEEIDDASERSKRAKLTTNLERAAANRQALGGVAGIGATVFDRADRWAYERATRLKVDPLAGFRLHQRLMENGWTGNAFAMDADRLKALHALARQAGRHEAVVAILDGLQPQTLQLEPAAMPLASVRREFSYDVDGGGSADPFAGGLVEAMLHMPALSREGAR